MSWQNELIPILRNVINDVDEDNYTYADTRLEELLVVAAQLVVVDVTNLTTTYTIDVTQYSISPDPTSTRDNAFINFVVLKAACLIDQGLYRTKAMAAGIRARCGPVVMDTMKHIDGFKDLITFGPCKAYETLKQQYIFGNSHVEAVLSPFVSNDFDPYVFQAYFNRSMYQ